MADKARLKKTAHKIPSSDAQILTLRQVADYLGLHYLTIYRLIQERKIPAARLGGRWRFKKDVLDRWIENDMNGRVEKITKPRHRRKAA